MGIIKALIWPEALNLHVGIPHIISRIYKYTLDKRILISSPLRLMLTTTGCGVTGSA